MLAIGIALNLFLNYLWLPVFGLEGAIWATVVSTGVVLFGAWEIMRRLDFPIDSQIYAISLLPLTLFLAPWSSLVASVLIVGVMPAIRDGLIAAIGSRVTGRSFGLSSI